MGTSAASMSARFASLGGSFRAWPMGSALRPRARIRSSGDRGSPRAENDIAVTCPTPFVPGSAPQLLCVNVVQIVPGVPRSSPSASEVPHLMPSARAPAQVVRKNVVTRNVEDSARDALVRVAAKL